MCSEILPLGDEDAGELLTLQRAAYVTEALAHRDLELPPLQEKLDGVLAALRDPRCQVWGIREGSRLVAAVRVTSEAGAAEVGRLVVAPDQQGRGLGSTLLRAAEQRLPAGVGTLRLFTGEHSAAALGLYAKLGYQEIRRTPEHDYLLVHLQKHLPRPSPDGVR